MVICIMFQATETAIYLFISLFKLLAFSSTKMTLLKLLLYETKKRKLKL